MPRRRDRTRHRTDDAAGAEANDSRDEERPSFRRRDVLRLIMATYRATLPYFLVFLLVMALATWLITEVLF